MHPFLHNTNQMSETRILANDRVRVWKKTSGSRALSNLEAVLYWGDPVRVGDTKDGYTQVTLDRNRVGFISASTSFQEKALLQLSFIDVGQGDSCLITTPGGSRLLIDGGENQRMARYLAKRFSDEMKSNGKVHLDAIIATHGDADHFEGLNKLIIEAANEEGEFRKICISTSHVFHNGIVKRSGSLPEAQRLGPTETLPDGKVYLPLIDDPRTVSNPNRLFKRWQESLTTLEQRGALNVARLDSDTKQVFDFIHDNVNISILGPRATKLPDGRSALPFLTSDKSSSLSASRTINGHSINLRIQLENVSILLTGDLNEIEEAELLQLHNSGKLNMRAEVLKVPHHGSDDVNISFLKSIQPLISIISAGDEDARRDYMHPRGNVLGMLGGDSRGARSVIFCTELAAFNKWSGKAFRAKKLADGTWVPDLNHKPFFARERIVHGIIHVRTNGQRLLVIRQGARLDRHELYAFEVNADGSAMSVPTDLKLM
jgi:beta-lactamase superfamily II metal-dependent hydrolase